MAVSMTVEVVNDSVQVAARRAQYWLRAYVTTSGQSYNDNQCAGSWQVKETRGANAGRTTNGDFTHSIPQNQKTRVLDVYKTIDYDDLGNASVTASVTFSTGISAGTITRSVSFDFPSIAPKHNGSVKVQGVGASGNYMDSDLSVLVGIPDVQGTGGSVGYDVYVASFGTMPRRGRVIGTGTASPGQFVTLPWTPTEAQYAQYLTTAETGTCTVQADFTANGVIFDSDTDSFPLSIKSGNEPTIGTVQIEDDSGAYEEYGVAVPGRSELTLSVSVTPNSLVDIRTVRYNVYGRSGSMSNTSGNTWSVSGISPSSASDGSGWIRAEDTRGLSATKYFTIPTQSAEAPTIGECRAYRYNTSTGQEDDESTTIRVEYNVGASSLGSVAASGTVTVKYTRSGTSSWTTAATRSFSSTSSSGYVNISNCSTSYGYSVQLTIEASNGLSSIQVFEVGTATPIMDFYEDSGVAFWGVANQSGLVVNKNEYLDGGLYMKTGGGTWQQVIRNNQQVDTVSTVYPEFDNGLLVRSPEWLAFTNAGGQAIFEFARLNGSNEIELNWPMGGLQGTAMKQIWSGSWSSGSISVSQIGYYSLFIIFCGGNLAGHRILATRLPSQTQSGSSSGTIYGIGGTGTGSIATYVYGVSLTLSGTSLSTSGAPVGGFYMSTSGTYTRVTAPITSIWGVL